MLTELTVSNFAIVEEQSVSFAAGLNVISGETGAGKSIILEALKFIVGGRASADFVRTGAESLRVEALFDLTGIDSGLTRDLPELVRESNGKLQAELLLSRELSSSGRGKVYINGRLGSVTLLQDICSRLVNICGQNQFMRLFDPAYHLELIDSYGQLESLLTEYGGVFAEWKAVRNELALLKSRIEQNVLRRAELEFLVTELGEIDLRTGLRADLEQETKRMQSAEQILEVSARIEEQLSAADEILGSVQVEMSSIVRFDPAVSKLIGALNQAKGELSEFGSGLCRYSSSLQLDQEKLSELRERLATVAKYERKYRTNEEGLLSLLAQAREELALCENPDLLKTLEVREQQLKGLLAKIAQSLTKRRAEAATKLSRSVERELSELNMKGAKLKVEFLQIEFSERGAERGEFLICTNPGEPFRPLKDIASGGELSRIMLVLKKVLRERSGVNVLVFDEVDSGVSGAVARAVGEKLSSLASSSQVIAITHLAQVASLADRHLLVQKGGGKRISSLIRTLSNMERIDEIARMLAGYEITEASRESARELLSSKIGV